MQSPIKPSAGRPRGSKNKGPRKHQPSTSAPIHEVTDDSSFRAAVLDILWHEPRQALTERQLIDEHISFIGKLKRANAFAVLSRMIAEAQVDVDQANPKRIRFITVATERSGWYYRGQLRSVRELARLKLCNEATLRKRLNNGWSLSEVMSTPIKADQSTRSKAA